MYCLFVNKIFWLNPQQSLKVFLMLYMEQISLKTFMMEKHFHFVVKEQCLLLLYIRRIFIFCGYSLVYRFWRKFQKIISMICWLKKKLLFRNCLLQKSTYKSHYFLVGFFFDNEIDFYIVKILYLCLLLLWKLCIQKISKEDCLLDWLLVLVHWVFLSSKCLFSLLVCRSRWQRLICLPTQDQSFLGFW